MSHSFQRAFLIGLIIILVGFGFGVDYWIIDTDAGLKNGAELHPGASIALVTATIALVGLFVSWCLDAMPPRKEK